MIGGPGACLIGKEEEKEILDVLHGGYLFRYGTEGEDGFQHKVVTFEKEMAERLHQPYLFATSSGTGALMCCLSALGVGAGDEVIVPGFTFIASIVSILLCNAMPVLAEIDESLNMDPAKLEALITPRTKAIMPVHMYGNPCDMDQIMGIAEKHKLYVIEDCCQGVGASYKGRFLGTIGDMGAYSLNMYKTITCGDGGFVGTANYDLYERAFGYHDQGHKPNRMGAEIGNRALIGMNMRMNELSGAVAVAQGRKLFGIVETLRKNKKLLKAHLTGVPGIHFRKINDSGECANVLTILFDTAAQAARFCAITGLNTNANSGWHVYNNMEPVLYHRMASAANCPFDCPRFPTQVELKRNMLPQTDDILARSVNIGVGLVGSLVYGVSIRSTEEEILAAAERIADAVRKSI